MKIPCTWSFFIALSLFFFVAAPHAAKASPAPSSTNDSTAISGEKPIFLPILLYHYVENIPTSSDKGRALLTTPPSIFKKQVATLSEAGYTFLTPENISDVISGKKELPAKAIILSFDDGYEDLYTNVFPILNEYHARGIAYIISGAVDHANYITLRQLKALASSTVFEIGAHTIHHAYLKHQPLSIVTAEISGSKKALEHTLNIPITSFAYPYGSYDDQAIHEVRKAGFTTALTTKSGTYIFSNQLFTIRRLRPGFHTGTALLKLVSPSHKETHQT